MRTRSIALIGGALTGCWVLFAASPRPGLTPDAMSYLGAAQSLVHTGALREPFAPWNSPDSTTALADYPAGFSLALALPIALGVPAATSARWVEALSAGAAVGIAAGLVGVAAGEAGALIAVLVLGLMPALADVSVMVVSEPLFLLCVSLTVWGLARHGSRPLVAGLAAAFGNLVRYAGVFLVAGVAVWQALQPGPWRSRVRRVAMGVAPAILLHLYWRLGGIVPGGGMSAATFSGLGDTFRDGWTTSTAWLVPGFSGPVATVAAAAVFALLGVAWWATWRKAGLETRSLLAICGLLAAGYFGTLVFTRLFVIPEVPFDARILLPLWFLLALGTALTLVTRRAVAVIAIWAVLATVRNVGEIRHTHAVGVEYETAEWQGSAVKSWLRGAGRGRVVFTNDPAGIWFTAGRPSRLLPESGAPDSVRAFQARFDSQPAALVGFDVPFVLESVSPDSLAAALHLTPVARFAHGVVWVR